MSFIALLNVVVVWCLIEQAKQCPVLYSPPHSSKKCNFALTFTDLKCSTFIFNSCVYSTCTKNLVAKDPNSTCVRRNQTRISNWMKCIETCCSGSTPVALTFTTGYLDQCSVDPPGSGGSSATQNTSCVGAIEGIVFGTVFVLVLLCFCLVRKNICALRDKYNNCVRCLKQALGMRSRLEANRSIQQDKDFSNTALQHSGDHVDAWQEGEKDLNQQDVCSVCLSQNPNVMLSCNHVMHSPCIARWIEVKMECSLCRSRKIHTVREYCVICRRVFLIKPIEEVAKGKSCQACRRKENNVYAI